MNLTNNIKKQLFLRDKHLDFIKKQRAVFYEDPKNDFFKWARDKDFFDKVEMNVRKRFYENVKNEIAKKRKNINEG